jgi:hypothetical protein
MDRLGSRFLHLVLESIVSDLVPVTVDALKVGDAAPTGLEITQYLGCN